MILKLHRQWADIIGLVSKLYPGCSSICTSPTASALYYLTLTKAKPSGKGWRGKETSTPHQLTYLLAFLRTKSVSARPDAPMEYKHSFMIHRLDTYTLVSGESPPPYTIGLSNIGSTTLKDNKLRFFFEKIKIKIKSQTWTGWRPADGLLARNHCPIITANVIRILPRVDVSSLTSMKSEFNESMCQYR